MLTQLKIGDETVLPGSDKPVIITGKTPGMINYRFVGDIDNKVYRFKYQEELANILEVPLPDKPSTNETKSS